MRLSMPAYSRPMHPRLLPRNMPRFVIAFITRFARSFAVSIAPPAPAGRRVTIRTNKIINE
eukprot:1815548-Pyramimonas_sp.AAC.1